MDVVLARGGHLLALHVADAPMRKQNEQLDVLPAAECLHRRGARVAGGCAQDRGAATGALERPLHEPRQDLHGEVLERGRRAMEQLQQKKIAADLRQRRGVRMAPPRIRIGDEGKKLVMPRIAAHAGRHHESRRRRVMARRKRGQRRQLRPSSGHIKPAIGRQPSQQDLLETGGRGLSARGDIHHFERPISAEGARTPRALAASR